MSVRKSVLQKGEVALLNTLRSGCSVARESGGVTATKVCSDAVLIFLRPSVSRVFYWKRVGD